ncbi:transposase, partial [Candidatus Pacearchaeota archaeon CG10_big_fil_rev_8_21_14_0_10_35_13]
MKSYKLKLFPTEEQTEKLELSLDICRQTYNHLLSELSNGFGKSELSNYLLDLKVCYPEMKQVYSKVLQVENDRLFANLSGLSGSKKNGNKVGRLRFKGKGWKKTFTFNQSGFKIL